MMNTCERCGGKFPTRTSGIAPDVRLCMSASQCDANLEEKQMKRYVVNVRCVFNARNAKAAGLIVDQILDALDDEFADLGEEGEDELDMDSTADGPRVTKEA